MKKVLLIVIVMAVISFAAVYYWQQTHITIGGVEYPLDLTELDLFGQSVPYARQLSRLTALEHLDLRYTDITPEDYSYLLKALPSCDILWLVPFQGQHLSPELEELTVTSLTDEEVALLACFPRLRQLNGLYCQDLEQLLAAQALYPHCAVTYRVPLDGDYYPWDATELCLAGPSFDALPDALALLPRVEKIRIQEPVTDPEALLGFMEAYPQLELDFSLALYGTTVTPDATFLDFSGTPIGDLASLEAALPLLPALTQVDMVDCGLSDEEMGALNSRWPNTLFVWEVSIGHFKLRTDITYFMPYQYRYVVSDKDADTLQYLTELICLDFGHMNITRTDYLAHMTKLQYLLICDTPITDLSPCANLKDLKYAEFFMTDVTDYTPLLECPNLVDLNIGYTYPTDPLIFTQMPQLENLWFRGMYDEQIMAQLKDALPNTRMVFRGGSSTGAGWRDLPNYFAQRDILGMGYMTG